MLPTVRDVRPALADLWPSVEGLDVAMLFGSVARGQAKGDSDIDVAVVGRGLDPLTIAAEMERRIPWPAQALYLQDPSIVVLQEIVQVAVPLFERTAGAYASWVARTLWQLEHDLPWYRRQQKAWLARVAQEGL